jgi:hypothetical protein
MAINRRRNLSCRRLGPSLRSGSFVRPVWKAASSLSLKAGPLSELHALERLVVRELEGFSELAELVGDSRLVSDMRLLYDNAANDLVAGCELARLGYFKQAYSLWRSWFEQVLFGLFFLESPIHGLAWTVQESLSLDKGPAYRLMLHQLLVEGRDGHPFALVFADRFEKVIGALKYSSVPKDKRVLKRTDKVLTAFSQGVHGTYRPRKIHGAKQVEHRLETEALPLLNEALKAVGQLWCLYVVFAFSIDEGELIQLKAGTLPASPQLGIIEDFFLSAPANVGSSAQNSISFLNGTFSRHFGVL